MIYQRFMLTHRVQEIGRGQGEKQNREETDLRFLLLETRAFLRTWPACKRPDHFAPRVHRSAEDTRFRFYSSPRRDSMPVTGNRI